MNPLADVHLFRLKNYLLKALRQYDVRIYLFGSRATGTARSFSDVDVAIEPKKKLPTGLLSRLRQVRYVEKMDTKVWL